MGRVKPNPNAWNKKYTVDPDKRQMGRSAAKNRQKAGTGEVSNVNDAKTNTTTITKEKTQKSGGVKNSSPAVSLRYPNNRIESSTDYLEIKIVEYTPNSKLNSSMQSAQAQGTSTKKEGKVDGNDSGGLTTSQKTTVMDTLGKGSKMETATSRARKAKPLAYIYLPIPQNVADNNSVNWASDSLDPLKALGANLAMTGMTNPGALLSGLKNIDGF